MQQGPGGVAGLLGAQQQRGRGVGDPVEDGPAHPVRVAPGPGGDDPGTVRATVGPTLRAAVVAAVVTSLVAPGCGLHLHRPRDAATAGPWTATS